MVYKSPLRSGNNEFGKLQSAPASRKFKPEPLRTDAVPLNCRPTTPRAARARHARTLQGALWISAPRAGAHPRLTPVHRVAYNLRSRTWRTRRDAETSTLKIQARVWRHDESAFRTWTKELQRTEKRITPCHRAVGMTAILKGKAYFDLHRDIVVHEAAKLKRRVSDGED